MQQSASTHFRRRQFLQSSTILAGAVFGGLAPGQTEAAESWPPREHSMVRDGYTIVFQGDSITDAGRSRERASTPNEQPGLGNGYAWFAAAELLVDRPHASLKIFNRGISGNKVYQLA